MWLKIIALSALGPDSDVTALKSDFRFTPKGDIRGARGLRGKHRQKRARLLADPVS
jgi:hypothetical protein